MPKPLVNNPDQINLAMLGMVEGNGHPYSWSAIINGRYDAKLMASCGYPVIPQYLGAQPESELGIPGAKVTHIWCDRRRDAENVAACTYIPNIVDEPEQVMGHVDAVIIATDIGHEHIDRALPFIKVGMPVFIDKPLTDNCDDLRRFATWFREGRPILSTSCMRYAEEFRTLSGELAEVGEPRIITVSMPKTWERYGIHAIEAVYGLLEPGGWESVQNTGDNGSNLVHARHRSGVDVMLLMASDLAECFGDVKVMGSRATRQARFADTFHAFKQQLVAFVDYLRTGEAPVDYQQTLEQMKLVIAGIRSRDEAGRRVKLSEITL